MEILSKDFMPFVSQLDPDMFNSIRKFINLYSSKFDHMDKKYWANEKDISMVDIHQNLLTTFSRLSKLTMTANVRQAIEIVVDFSIITFFYFQQAIRKPSMRGRVSNSVEYTVQSQNMKNLLYFIRNIGSNYEQLPKLLERFLYKDINPDGTNEGIQKFLRYVRKIN